MKDPKGDRDGADPPPPISWFYLPGSLPISLLMFRCPCAVFRCSCAPTPGGFAAGRWPGSWGRPRVSTPPRPSTQPPRIPRNLIRDAWRRDTLLYAAPQELLDLEERDLLRRFKHDLDHIHETGRLRPSDLQLAIYASPQYCKQSIQGYSGGEFDPEKLGVAYIVIPPAKGYGPRSQGVYNLNPVPTPFPPYFLNTVSSRPPPPSLPAHPSDLTHLNHFRHALVRA